MSKLITAISSDKSHDWVVSVDGDHINTRHVVISNPRFGTLSFGMRPEGSVGWMWEEIGGGGVGIVPFTIHNRRLFIGLITQERGNNLATRNIPRGFLNPGTTHFESAEVELMEETGIVQPNLRLVPLGGEPANPNSTFFDITPGQGFQYFAFEVGANEVEALSPKVLIFREGIFNPKTTIAEKIMACHFWSWQVAAQIADNFSSAGVARLLAARPELVHYL